MTSPQVHIYNEQKDMALSARSLRQILCWTLEQLCVETDEISVLLVTDRKMRALHQELFSDPSSTDCITVPIDPLPKKEGIHHFLGEAILCPKTALLYSKKNGLCPHLELYRYLIHCCLHFAGYTDTEVQEKRKMRRKENELARKLPFILKLKL